MTAIERGLCWACEQRYGPNRNRDSEGTFDFPICDECYAQMDRAWPVGLLIFAGLTLVGGLTFDWASEAWGVAGGEGGLTGRDCFRIVRVGFERMMGLHRIFL